MFPWLGREKRCFGGCGLLLHGLKAACSGGLGSGMLVMNQDFAALALQVDFCVGRIEARA